MSDLVLGIHRHFTVDDTPSVNIDVFLNDCLRGMEKLPTESIDVVVTSPPYNLGIKYNTYNDDISRSAYLDWLREWAVQLHRVMHPQASLFLNIGSKPSDQWVPMEVAMALREYFHLQNTIHWIKSIVIDDAGINVGHIKPINSSRYLSDAHEHIFHFTKTGDVKLDRLAIGTPYKHKSNVSRWQKGKQDVRCRGNVWYIPYKTINSRAQERPHPASFPMLLAQMCISLHGSENVHTVMDPFMGIGTTAVVCVQLKKSFIGYEIDPEYFATSCERIETAISAGGK